MRTESLDSVRAVFQTPIEFADASTPIQIRVPTARQLSASVCRGQTMADDGIVLGDVEVQNDTVLTPKVTIVAEWEQPTVQRDASGVVTVAHPKRHAETRPDGQGVFRICGVPTNTTVWLRASADGVFGDYVAVHIPAAGRFTRASLLVDHNAPNLATLSGVVVTDSTNAPIAGAEVAISELTKVTLTDARGVFRLAGIPSGEYTVTARHIGYGPLEARINIATAEAVERRLILSRVVMLDSVVVRAEATNLRMREFEDNRKIGLGHFLTRVELEKLSGITMGALLSQFTGTDIAHSRYGSYLTSARWKSKCNPLDGDCLDREKLYTFGPGGWKCHAQVYLDNVLMNRGRPTELFDLRSVHQSQIEAIEYYEGPATAPSKYNKPGSECGVLVIHTRYGD